jgi:hypothetical protein
MNTDGGDNDFSEIRRRGRIGARVGLPEKYLAAALVPIQALAFRL